MQKNYITVLEFDAASGTVVLQGTSGHKIKAAIEDAARLLPEIVSRATQVLPYKQAKLVAMYMLSLLENERIDPSFCFYSQLLTDRSIREQNGKAVR